MYQEYKPNKETSRVLDAAYGYIESVNYNVSLRWIFYRLLQDGYFDSKEDYAKLKDWVSRARKRFYQNWHPSTLVDEGRKIDTSWDPCSREDMIRKLPDYADIVPNLYENQEQVPFLIFEAATMSGQFEYFAEWADRAAFRGDASVPHKWNIAKRCDELYQEHERPIHILYFGDLDKKGLQIPRSAMNDVLDWINSDTEIEFTRCGINDGHAERFNLPEKSLKVGTYEWESLGSDDAEELIVEGLSKAVDVEKIKDDIADAETQTTDLQIELARHLQSLI